AYGASPIAEWARASTPPPLLTVSEWADRYRSLPETSDARGGRWRTSTVPYLKGVMDAIHEPPVRKIALMKCHQSGGSEAQRPRILHRTHAVANAARPSHRAGGGGVLERALERHDPHDARAPRRRAGQANAGHRRPPRVDARAQAIPGWLLGARRR